MIHQQEFSLIQQLLASCQQDHYSNKVPNDNHAEIKVKVLIIFDQGIYGRDIGGRLAYLKSFPITSSTGKHFA